MNGASRKIFILLIRTLVFDIYSWKQVFAFFISLQRRNMFANLEYCSLRLSKLYTDSIIS
jgi:hypothetical protein